MRIASFNLLHYFLILDTAQNRWESSDGVDPFADLVRGLNERLGEGSYAAVETGVLGTDAIRVGILYRPATVTPEKALASMHRWTRASWTRATALLSRSRSGSGARSTCEARDGTVLTWHPTRALAR